MKLHNNFEILPVTRFNDPRVIILTPKIHTGSCLWFCKIIPEAVFDKLILAHFPGSQWEVGTREHRSITEKGILRRVSVSIFKTSKKFQIPKKGYNSAVNWVVKRFWKNLKTISAYTESTDYNARPLKNIHLVTLFYYRGERRRPTKQKKDSSLDQHHKKWAKWVSTFNLFKLCLK